MNFSKFIPHSRPFITADEENSMKSILKTGFLSEGEVVSKLENEITKKTSGFDTVMTSSGMHAIALSLEALDVYKKVVLLPGYTCRALIDAIYMVGAIPCMLDVGHDYLIDIQSLQRAISKFKNNIGAIIVVNQFGIRERIAELMDYGYPVIEDCSHRFPSDNDGADKSDIKATCLVFSFHSTKILSSAEGGAITSSIPELMKNIRNIKKGLNTSGEYKKRFVTSMSDLHATILVNQLKSYEKFLARRRFISGKYRANLYNYVEFAAPERNVIFREPLQHDNVDEIIKYLEIKGILARRPIDPPIFKFCRLETLNNAQKEFPGAEMAFKRTFSLPLYPSLLDSEVDRVIKTMINFFKSRN